MVSFSASSSIFSRSWMILFCCLRWEVMVLMMLEMLIMPIKVTG